MNTAILIPCYNEELTIEKVIQDFKLALPDAKIYVYDNNSIDKTSEIAKRNGATVRKERLQGKGNVIRTMFRDIDADVYIMVDGDDTYPAEECSKMAEYILSGEADMVIGDRLTNGTYQNENKRNFHNFGNNLVKSLINALYKSNLKDIMSGYRCFNKKFVKMTPVLSSGFEIETEMSLHALDKKFLIKEVPINYRNRPVGSKSKLNTFSDGFKVIKTIFFLFKNYKPFVFFGILGFVFMTLGLLVGIPVLIEYFEHTLIFRIPSAILSVGLIVLSMLFFICGIILDTVVQNYKCLYELELNKFAMKVTDYE